MKKNRRGKYALISAAVLSTALFAGCGPRSAGQQ